MADTFSLPLIIEDGRLWFDLDAIDTLASVLPNQWIDLESWLDALAPDDLLHGTFHFTVPVRIESWDDDGPVLRIVEGGEG